MIFCYIPGGSPKLLNFGRLPVWIGLKKIGFGLFLHILGATKSEMLDDPLRYPLSSINSGWGTFIAIWHLKVT